MGAADYRSLVPRTPPEGLREWVLKNCRSELGRHGLVYEVDYDDMFCDWPMAIPEGYKRTKMVRVTCSCCGDSMLLTWGKDGKHGYGFVLPDDEAGDWDHTITAAGDEARCPMCGEEVLVNKRPAIRDYYLTAEHQVMSAGVLDPGGELVLTGWTVQRRVYKSGRESLEFLPAETYVFTSKDCVQLMGWRNGYSGTGGYFIQYGPWRQPKQWHKRWGWEENIFGLTPELIGRSCLPHCKLDTYMVHRPGTKHYPVAYLRLYQHHPNVEAVLLHGLPRLLDELIAKETKADAWEENKQGRMELPEIDWTQTRPAQMLGLTKEELRMGRAQGWGALFWNLFVGTKRTGELLTAEDIQNAFRLGDENVSMLIPRGQVAKSLRYLLRQCQVLAQEVDAAGADPVPDAQLLTDYWTMAELFRIRRRVLKKYAFISHGLLIRPAASQRELSAEGDALHHCVGTYGERHAKGETAIFLIRRAARAKEPYFTLELDERNLEVRQNRGNHNCARTPEVEAFEKEWLAWVRAGAPRDRNGQPVCPKNAGLKREAA